MTQTSFRAIPTNIVTGFLGVGKTTAIQGLLEHKPASETWAVLVNEFGEIGIDGHLLNSVDAVQSVYIRDVPGGCLCCAAGVPFRVALNQLIKQSHPHRLLIEPTGLGHPHEIIGMLTSAHYANIIDLRATLTLVDARKIADPRYRDHNIFRQQLQVADRIIANKQDLYREKDMSQLIAFLSDMQLQHCPLSSVVRGRLQYDWLQAARSASGIDCFESDGAFFMLEQSVPLPECGYRRVDNQGGGFCSSGWLFESRFQFDFDKLYQLFSQLEVERLKAIVLTERGWFVFNRVDDVLMPAPLDYSEDNRIEVIGRTKDIWANLEGELLSAVLNCMAVQGNEP